MSDQNAALFDKLDGFYVTKSEHDWLERRFSNMTEKEKILFQGAMELEKPQEIGHVMRIASQLDCYDLFYGTIVMDSEQPQGVGTSAGGMAQGIQAAPDSRKTVFRP